MSTFVMLKRGEKANDLLMQYPNAFLLLTLIAMRARRTPNLIKNLDVCECQLGDYKACGLTEQKYRTAKLVLEKLNLATFETTNKGTIGKLINTDIYNINPEIYNEQSNKPATNKQRTDNEQITTNNNVNKDNKEKNVNKDMDSAKRIITKLNELAGKKFRFGTNNTKNIIGRLKEGFTESDCLKVLETKIKDKYFMDNMKYYCPETLFRPSNFEKYLNETPVEKEGLVICLDRTIYDKSDYQAKGLHKTSDVVYMNLRPEFITDGEREEVELNTSRFISEFCEGGF